MLRRENGVSNAQPFLCGPLRTSAFSAFNGNFNAEDAEDAEVRREKRITFGLFVQSRLSY
jgi:hypothetical protein